MDFNLAVNIFLDVLDVLKIFFFEGSFYFWE